MFSTPLICSSIGATTVEATTSALAPGYWPDTLMIGGAISGYCATGRRRNATAPRITKTIETTDAKIGRSMKKCEIRIEREALLRGRPRRFRLRSFLLLRRHLGTGTRQHQSVDDDAIVGHEAFLDDTQSVDDLAERHIFLACGALAVDDQHIFARLLARDRSIGDEQRLVGGRARHPYAREHARREHAARVGELRAGADRAGRPVDHVVDEVHVAAVGELPLVEELERDDDVAAAPGHFLAVARQALVAQVGGLIERKLQPDRIYRDDGCKQRGVATGAAGDQVALRHPPVADSTSD